MFCCVRKLLRRVVIGIVSTDYETTLNLACVFPISLKINHTFNVTKFMYPN
jgi:hypothetical protein